MNEKRRVSRLGVLRVSALGIATIMAPLWAGAAPAVNTIDECGTVIDSPGDYQLAADLRCRGDGIAITASGVHLQMAGHVLTGNGSGTGLTIRGVAGDIDVRNGTLTGFATGIHVIDAQGVSLVAVTATGNDTGMVLERADSNEFTDTLVMDNAGDGIQASSSTHNVFTGSVSNGNGGAGLLGRAFDNNVLTANGFHENSGDGIRLDGGSNGNLLRANDVSNDEGDGVRLVDADANTLRANIVRSNAGTGIRVQAGSLRNLLQANTAQQNALDVADLNRNPCVANTWKRNNFTTDSEGDGSQAGCLQ